MLDTNIVYIWSSQKKRQNSKPGRIRRNIGGKNYSILGVTAVKRLSSKFNCWIN